MKSFVMYGRTDANKEELFAGQLFRAHRESDDFRCRFLKRTVLVLLVQKVECEICDKPWARESKLGADKSAPMA